MDKPENCNFSMSSIFNAIKREQNENINKKVVDLPPKLSVIEIKRLLRKTIKESKENYVVDLIMNDDDIKWWGDDDDIKN